MFGFLEDMARGVGKVIGTATGLIVGVPIIVIAEALGITTGMVQEAIDAGCDTYEEIKSFFDLG